MATKIAASFLSLLMPVIVALNGLSVSVPFFNNSAQIEYVFSNDLAGSAEGTVTVSSNVGGTYELYWGDENGEKLYVDVNGSKAYYSELADVKVSGGKGSTQIIDFTAIPEGAKTVTASINGFEAGKIDIPENKIAQNGKKEYVFGALSDLHFNRYNLSLSGDDAMLTFPNALNFLDSFGVELVGMSGDLSSGAESDAFEKFNLISSNYDFPVYTCTGNHDVSSKFTLESWQANVNSGVYTENKAEGIKAVAENGLDFVYAPDSANGDVFVFLSQYRWDYGKKDSRLLKDEQLDWLEAQLKAYKDSTVFLFFHTFLANADGVAEMGEGNLINKAGNAYDLVFTPGAKDEIRFRSLMQEYKNVVFFNGHSHWAYDMQKFNPQLNITDHNGTYATMVHLSSVSAPRRTTDNSTSRYNCNMISSEGMIVTVYENSIVFTACDFLRGEFLAYATYVVNK